MHNKIPLLKHGIASSRDIWLNDFAGWHLATSGFDSRHFVFCPFEILKRSALVFLWIGHKHHIVKTQGINMPFIYIRANVGGVVIDMT